MSPPKEGSQKPESGSASPFAEVKYSLPELLRDVKQDRSSSLFSMEKLDQDAISRLFEQHNSRRASKPGKE
jgi:hypothetical protein